ncbi:tail fiber protein [Salmonella enterica]|uniref:tail fiber protein n=1 Tax=Salmonella enterica TaxID=28901 RepID=UPI0009AC4547|nr:tail fiber protein [Salmonella enterica]
MGKLTETEKWEDEVYQIETSDPVLGGPDGVSNRPQKQLANRTQWLKKQLEEANNALDGHERSRNHPDATLTDRGFVKLYSGVASMDETMAATPKAVKIAMDNANARLAKDRNLADLTNVQVARQSLGLGNSATRNLGTAPGTVAMGNDARIIATKKAIDDTQTGLSSQGVMWISSADDLSNLPSGARRFARNNTGVTVLPSADYFFLEVLAKRDVANGSCILATSNTGNVWIGLRYAVPANAAFTWTQLNQNVQNLGLTEAVNRALNAVQKTGDIMTGNLFLKNDGRMHFAIVDEDGNVRMWLYKDKGGDGVRINNGYDGGGEFVFNKNGEFYSPSHLHAGAAIFGNNGDVYGSAWGNTWLTSWITNQLNMRATTGWVNQNFITRVMRGAPVNPGKVNEYGPAEAPAGCVVTSVRHDPTTAFGIYFTYRPLSVFINGGWRVIEG